jgi:pyruvate/2-oxoglutarate dehydrogenase complex dihydrolipoamide acyltransferase (E2) component
MRFERDDLSNDNEDDDEDDEEDEEVEHSGNNDGLGSYSAPQPEPPAAPAPGFFHAPATHPAAPRTTHTQEIEQKMQRTPNTIAVSGQHATSRSNHTSHTPHCSPRTLSHRRSQASPLHSQKIKATTSTPQSIASLINTAA